VFDHDIDAFDNHAILTDEVDTHSAALSFVLSGDNDDLIAATNLSHGVSAFLAVSHQPSALS
jgi:hypothetical protein